MVEYPVPPLNPDTGRLPEKFLPANLAQTALDQRYAAFGSTSGSGTAGRGFNPRGTWVAGTTYAVDDIVTANGSVFRVRAAHTAGTTAPSAATPGTNYEVWAAAGAVGAQGPGFITLAAGVTTPPSGTPAGTIIFQRSGSTTVTQPTISASSSSVTSTTATFAWQVTNAGTESVTGWDNGRSGTDASGGGAYQTVDAASVASRTFINLVPGASYTFNVTAVTASGRSNTVTTTVTLPAASGSTTTQPVITASASNVTSTTATLNWSVSTTGAAVTGWDNGRNGADAGGSGAYQVVDPASATSRTFLNLIAGSTYALNVTAVTASGRSNTVTVNVTLPAASSGGTTPTPTTPVVSGSSTTARWWRPNGNIPLVRPLYTTGINSDGRIQVDWAGSMPDSRAATSVMEVNVPTYAQNAFQAYVVDLSSNTTIVDSGVVSSAAETWTASSFTPVAGRRYKAYIRVRSADNQWSAYDSTRFVAPSGKTLYMEDYGAVGDGVTQSGTNYNGSPSSGTGPLRAAMQAAGPGDVIRSKVPGTLLTVTASGTTLTATSGTFTSAMVNKNVIVYGAGTTDTSTNSYAHRTTITAVASNGSSATINTAVKTNGTGLKTLANYPEYWVGHLDVDGGLGGTGVAGGWTLDGTGAVFTSLNVDSSGFRTTIPDITYRNVHFWQKTQTTRGNGKNGDTGPFFIEGVNAVGIRVIGCYAERARDAGFLVYDRSSDIYFVDCVADHTNADGFHVTGSAHHIQFIRPLNTYIGDDGVANIGYRGDGDANRPHDIVWENPRVIGQDWGRGVSFGGCYNCLVTDLYIERGAGASFILGSDADMANTSNIQLRRGSIVSPNLRRGLKPTYTQGSATGSTIPDEPWLKLLNSSSTTRQRDILLENFTITDGRYIQIIRYGSGEFQDGTIIVRGVTMTGSTNSGTNWLDQSTYPGHIDMRGVSVPSGSTPASAPTASNGV